MAWTSSSGALAAFLAWFARPSPAALAAQAPPEPRPRDEGLAVLELPRARLRHSPFDVAILFGGHGEEDEPTLRNDAEAVSAKLREDLQARVAVAGVAVDETHLMHLAYAPEIAGAMLRRQQAEAVIGARKQIVLGAVSMVEMALKGLTERGVVELDTERRAAMVSNLLVVLCAESEAQPVINAGSLYQ